MKLDWQPSRFGASPAPSRLDRIVAKLAIFRPLAFGVLVAALAILPGCTKPAEIEAYSAPSSRAQEKVRLLAAIIKRGDDVWFIKLLGPVPAIKSQQPTFDRFLDSLNFPPSGEPAIAWTLPEGWTHEKGKGMRFATFKLSDGDAPLEVTITKLGGESASIVDNVNRWRKLDLGLTAISDGLVSLVTNERHIAGGPATFVDMAGPGVSKRAMLPPEPPPTPRSPLEFETPEGWKERAPDKGRVIVLGFADGEQRGEVGVMPLSGMGGGLLPNVNRWRGQLGLDAWSEDELKKEMRGVAVDGEAAVMVELAGKGDSPQSIVGVVAPRKGLTWFITMKGPAPLVGRQRSAFDTFLKSVRFVAGSGDNDE